MSIRKKPLETTTIHTKLSYYLVILAFIVEIIIGLVYFNSQVQNDALFGTMCLIEGVLCLIGFILADIIMAGKITMKLSKQRFVTFKPLYIGTVIVIILVLIAVQFFIVPLTIREPTKAMANIFAGVCEEMIFRGFVLSIFIKLSRNSKKYVLYKSKNREITISKPEILGALFSALLFMLFHQNYYGMPLVLITIFYSGIIYSLAYILSRSITAVILAHFILNFTFVINTFFMVGF